MLQTRMRRAPTAALMAVTTATLIEAIARLPMANAHEHGGDHIEEGHTISDEPIDSVLWAHIFLQMFAFGVMYPVGMVLGIIKSRWHVPLQVLASCVAIVGYFLGHLHKGRQFVGTNAHSRFANPVYLLLIVQITMGVYLKLHLERGVNGVIRRVFARPIHSVVGKAIPLVSWVQMLFGGITALGFCQGEHVGQCAAHFIMGSAFIAYGVILTILLLVGQVWLRRTGRSQEFFDSVVIAAWGCVNTFTEHRWGTAWVRNDWQHTTMGIVWWCAGLAGVWLSRGRDGGPKRNFIPGFVILITGWAMSAHPQDLPISAMTHKMFGYTLMAAGLTRIIEVSFVLQDKGGVSEDGRESNSFQYIPVFLLYASGFLFMGATEEQMLLVAASGLDHVAYILILYSFSFLLFLFVCMLIHIYDRAANPLPAAKDAAAAAVVGANGHAARGTLDERRARDAEEFELEGLMTDDEEEHGVATRRPDRAGRPRDDVAVDGEEEEAMLGSPSTVGKNNDSRA